MEWCDIIKAMIARDAAEGKRRKWTQAMVYGRWFRNAVAIHDEHYEDDEGFDYDTLRLQKKETSSGRGWKKRKMALRLKTARLESEKVEDGDEDMQKEEDEEMVEQNEKGQETAAANAEEGLSAQFNRASLNTGLITTVDDLITLRSCHDEIRKVQEADFWTLVADKMNERAIDDNNQFSSERQRWSAEDCEAAMHAGSV